MTEFVRSADEIRIEKKLSIAEVLERAGIARQTWYRIVNRENRAPHEETIRRISDALGVRPEEIREFSEIVQRTVVIEEEGRFQIISSPASQTVGAAYRTILGLARELDANPKEAEDLLLDVIMDKRSLEGKSPDVERKYRLWRRRRANLEQQGRELEEDMQATAERDRRENND